jgi:ABC-2 type transport system permease protein
LDPILYTSKNFLPATRRTTFFFSMRIMLQLYMSQWLNQFKFIKLDQILKNLLLSTFALLVAWAEWTFFNRFFDLLLQVPFGFQLAMPHLFSYMGSFLFAFLAYSSILTALSSLYHSSDLPLLLSFPLNLKVLLLSRWLDVFIRSSITLIFLMIPPMISLYQVTDPGFFFFLIYLLTVFALAALATSTGFIVAMVLMLFFPARRLHQSVAVLGLIFATFLILALRYLNIEQLWSEQALSNPLILFLREEPGGIFQYGPGKLFASSTGRYLISAPHWWTWFLVVLGLGAFSIWFALVCGRWIYLKGWWKSQEQADPSVRRFTFSSYQFWQRTPFSPLVRSMLWKDWMILTRDPSVWTQLFMMIPLAVLYLLNLSFLPIQEDAIQPILSICNVGLIGLIIAAVGARFLFPAASREGRAVWIPFVSPMQPIAFIFQKGAFVLPPVWFLGLLLLILSCWTLELHARAILWTFLYGTYLIALLGIQAVCLGICFPAFHYHHLLEVSLGKGAFLFMVVALLETGSLVYLGLKDIFITGEISLPLLNTDFILWGFTWLLVTLLIYYGSIRRLNNPNLV